MVWHMKVINTDTRKRRERESQFSLHRKKWERLKVERERVREDVSRGKEWLEMMLSVSLSLLFASGEWERGEKEPKWWWERSFSMMMTLIPIMSAIVCCLFYVSLSILHFDAVTERGREREWVLERERERMHQRGGGEEGKSVSKRRRSEREGEY